MVFSFKYRSRRLPGVWYIEKSIPDDIVLTHLGRLTLIGCFLIFNNHFCSVLFFYCHVIQHNFIDFARMIQKGKKHKHTITTINKPNLNTGFTLMPRIVSWFDNFNKFPFTNKQRVIPIVLCIIVFKQKKKNCW